MTTCKKPLKVEPASWTFVLRDGAEPINNAAERAMRHGVLRRKGSY